MERTVSYVRQNFWPRVPDAITLAGLNTRVGHWTDERDQRIHGTTFAKPAARWAADYAGATPYDPSHLWVFGEPWDRKVTPDAFVHWEGHRFAMPWEAAGHHVEVRRTPAGIAIYWDHQVIATYDRPTDAHQVVGVAQWHASPPPERARSQPVARRRTLAVPDATIPQTRDLAEYEQVVPQ
ncbi:MAG: hypothetical protein M0Z36_11475 [Thermaerobacter sp.]|nr:hypothetical protein [Thermaerobacter sp.]